MGAVSVASVAKREEGINVSEYVSPSPRSKKGELELERIEPTMLEVNEPGKETLIEQAPNWLGRSRNGIHVSDLGFMKKAYWQKKHPEVKPTERDVGYYFEQLGAYCAMMDSHDSKLILFYLNAQASKKKGRHLIKVYDVHFDDLNAIKGEIVRRKKLLEHSLEEDDLSILPDRPRWACSGCRYWEFCKGGGG